MQKGKTIEWSAHEHEHKPKSPDWFWALGIIAVSGALSAIIFGNPLFALLLIVGAFVLAIHAAKPPEEITFQISDRGVRIGSALYPYRTLESFFVEHDEDGRKPKLLLKSRKMFVPYLIIPLEGVSPAEVEERLSEILEEEEMAEPLSQKVLEFFGF